MNEEPSPRGVHRRILHLLDFTREFEEATNGIGLVWFRGQADASWDLTPGVLREEFERKAQRRYPHLSAPQEGRSPVFAVERLMNTEFQRQGAALLREPDDPVSVYLEAQHWGLPTRLLDWTTDPLVALFFACVEHQSCKGTVWVFSPYDHYYYRIFEEIPGQQRVEGVVRITQTPVKAHHEAFVGQVYNLFSEYHQKPVLPENGPDERLRGLAANSGGKFSLPKSRLRGVLPVLPGLKFERISSQQGCFTFHPDGSGDLTGLAQRIDVEAHEKAEVLEDLRRLGVTWARIYPELGSIARAVRSRYIGQ